MPTLPDSYSVRFVLPDLIERGAANVLRLRVYRDGALVAPSAATVTVYDAGRTARLPTASATVAGSEASYTWTPDAALPLGDGWEVEWAATISGTVYTWRNSAALVRRRLWCPVTDADLYRMEPALDPAGEACLTAETTYQAYIDEAWTQTQSRLLAAGNRPNLVCEPHALRGYVLHLVLALVYGALASRSSAAGYGEKDARYRELASNEWGRINFAYAAADTEGATSRRPARPSVWLMGRGDLRHRLPRADR